MQKVRGLAIGNFLTLAIHIALSYATQMKLVNPESVADVSNKYTTLFTPAGITFAIWGLIYLALILLCIYHLFTAFTRGYAHDGNKELLAMGGAFMLNNIFTAAWLLIWTREMILASAILILFQLFTLIVMYTRLGIYNSGKRFASIAFTQFPISIYMAWICIATIANISSYQVSIGWNGNGLTPVQWTIIMIAVAVLITLLVVFVRRDIFFPLVVIWALFGIVQKRWQEDGNVYGIIVSAAFIGIGIVGLAFIVQAVINVNHKKKRIPFPVASEPIK